MAEGDMSWAYGRRIERRTGERALGEPLAALGAIGEGGDPSAGRPWARRAADGHGAHVRSFKIQLLSFKIQRVIPPPHCPCLRREPPCAPSGDDERRSARQSAGRSRPTTARRCATSSANSGSRTESPTRPSAQQSLSFSFSLKDYHKNSSFCFIVVGA